MKGQTINTRKQLKAGDLYYVIYKTNIGYAQPELTLYRPNIDYCFGFWFETKEEADEFFNLIPRRVAAGDRCCILEVATVEALNEVLNTSSITQLFKQPKRLEVGLNIVVVDAMSIKPLKFLYSHLFNLIQM